MQSQVRFNRAAEKVPEKVWEALVRSQVRFNRVPETEALVHSQVRFNRVADKVPEKVREKVPGGFGAEPGQVPEKVPETVWEAFVQSQVRFNGICGHFIHGNPPEVFPSVCKAWFRSTLQKKM